MDTADRIHAIDRVSAGLVDYNNARLQMILRQFQAETFDWEESDWSKREYIINRVETLIDQRIEELDVFLQNEASHRQGSMVTPVKKSWSEFPTGVFLSHKFEDAELMSRIRTGLHRFGVDAFVAHQDIHVSDIWLATIIESLDSCDALVAVLQADFHKSEWCDQEVGWALGRHIPVMVVRPTNLTGPRKDGFLEQLQNLPIDRDNNKCAEFVVSKIIDFLLGRPEVRHQMAESLVFALEHPGRHRDAIDAWRAVKALDYSWPDALLRRIRSAWQEQAFFKNAYTIPDEPYKALPGYEGSSLQADEDSPF